jgi:WD40 repeat protein
MGKTAQVPDSTTMPHGTELKYFDPCAATASMFLYAQGSSVACCHHDTLAIERIFSRHASDIQLLAVDNHSEAGGGRFVVSYDADQTAIVWDLMTGDEISRFACRNHLTVAAWMKNGNVAFSKLLNKFPTIN